MKISGRLVDHELNFGALNHFQCPFWEPKIAETPATPPKTNMSSENQWLEDVFPIETVPFKGDMLVFIPIWGNDPI